MPTPDVGNPVAAEPPAAPGRPPRRRPIAPPNPRFVDGSMPPDLRFAEGWTPHDPRFADASMPPDPRVTDGSMPPDPRFTEGSMPHDPRFAAPGPHPSMPPDPRYAAGPMPRDPRRLPLAEQPTEVIPSLLDEPAEQPREHLDDLFDDEYDDYREYEEYEDGDDGEYEGEYEDAENPPPDEAPAKPRRRRKRTLGWVAAIVVLVLFAGGAWFGYEKFFGYDDFDGSGQGDALVQVEDGDTTSAIGAKLTGLGVVASTKAFVKAGADNAALSRIQQGYYLLKQHMSGVSAVEAITSPSARVGRLEIRPYTQFDDITQADGKVTPGVFTLMSKASCATLNGKSTCIPVDALRKTVADADLKAFGVPTWAVENADKAAAKDKRLEGLIAPGVYDVKPGWTADELVKDLVHQSTGAIQAAGLGPQNTGPGMTPYQTLIIASLIEREAITPDFGKISRVLYNRLGKNMKLQLDSTVNYALDRPTLLTKPEDRDKAGPYNTYANTGLPPTPIGVPSTDAIKAAVKPTPGDWEFFVKCEKDGHSCFAVTNEEHNQNRILAQSRGAY
ncbi:UPF0755 protein [Amycolatopsis sulphurea]|uniref:Endolytic murein transglycosylase n=1 Tax=Amycolatopsis sulphurea TaxID=76022 RepID=A0A2A9G1I7_9PSEU|nr:UPF0755 protein [Amycolatopsis sulphurea]